MDVLQSRLAKRHSQLAQEIKELLTKAQELGAQDGVLRMELVCDQYDDVLPDIAYNWINLNAFQSEIEEAFYKARPNELVSFGRNVVAILPLIVTWFAVFEATNTYQQDIALHPQDRSIPFLQLWQNGFHGTTWFTFSVSAGIIFMLLLILVVLLFLGQTLNRSAKSSATKLVGSLRVAAGKLIEAIVADSRIMPYRPSSLNYMREIARERDVFEQEEIIDVIDTLGDSSNLIINRASTLRIRIVEEPLTALNLMVIISAFTELHAKCWLIQQGRFSDLIDYAQTHSTRFIKEAGLVVTKLTLNSPADIEFAQTTPSDGSAKNTPIDIKVNVDASPRGIMEALRTAIDAIIQAPLRLKAAQLETRAKEVEIKYKEAEGHSQLADKEQNRQIEAQNAELAKQKTLLEIERETVEIEKQRLALQSERLELKKKRIEYALATASEVIDALHPGTNDMTKAMLARTLLPNLLQLGRGHGLELTLPAAAETQETENK